MAETAQATRLIRELLEAGYTGAEIARELGITRQYVYRINYGDRGHKMPWPTMERLLQFHRRAFGARK